MAASGEVIGGEVDGAGAGTGTLVAPEAGRRSSPSILSLCRLIHSSPYALRTNTQTLEADKDCEETKQHELPSQSPRV